MCACDNPPLSLDEKHAVMCNSGDLLLNNETHKRLRFSFEYVCVSSLRSVRLHIWEHESFNFIPHWTACEDYKQIGTIICTVIYERILSVSIKLT